MSDARWVKATDAGVARALVLARELPESETKHGLAVPFPFKDRAGYQDEHDDSEINAAIERAPVVSVPLGGLHAIQHSVKLAKLEEHLLIPREPGAKHPEADTPTDRPVVVQQDGERYIHDGHHRLTAAWLRGRSSARVRLVNFDKDKP